MTERKPPEVTVESWVDKQIREATARGELDNLPGAGEPLSEMDAPYDEHWWLKQKLRRENLPYLPPSLALRKAVEEARETARQASTEARVRKIVTDINAVIRDAYENPPSGPPLKLALLDVERVVREWRGRHQGA